MLATDAPTTYLPTTNLQANGLSPPADRADPAPLLAPPRHGAVLAVAAGEYYGVAALRGGGGGSGGGLLVWGAHARSQTPVPLRGLRGGGAVGAGRVLSLAGGYQHALARVECNSSYGAVAR